MQRVPGFPCALIFERQGSCTARAYQAARWRERVLSAVRKFNQKLRYHLRQSGGGRQRRFVEGLPIEAAKRQRMALPSGDAVSLGVNDLAKGLGKFLSTVLSCVFWVSPTLKASRAARKPAAGARSDGGDFG